MADNIRALKDMRKTIPDLNALKWQDGEFWQDADMGNNDSQYKKEIKEASSKVDGLLGSDKAAAMKAALARPPRGTKSDSVKSEAADVFIKVAAVCKDAEMGAIVGKLNPEELDTAMKYIYRGLAHYKSCGVLLKWHGAIVEKAGIGCVVRALTDRKTVI